MSGMKSTVCPGGFQPAACRGQDGRLWFPTQDGLVQIDLQQLGPPPPPPIPRIERVQADGLTLPLDGQIVLTAGTATIDFHFAAAAFADPRQVEFSSRLEGFEEGWSRPATLRSRRIGPLKAGSYAFRIRARGISGTWKEVDDRFSFTIQPYFIGTPWFFVLLLAGVGSLAAGLVFYRRHQTRRRLEDKYKASPLGSDKACEYAARLEQAMKKDKLYLDAELSLTKLAAAMSIPSKQLSQVINEHLRMNFNDFVNHCRIEEAKRLLLEPGMKDIKLLRIAFESGFNSKSVFNVAFKKNTGLSPSEFRRLMGGGHENQPG